VSLLCWFFVSEERFWLTLNQFLIGYIKKRLKGNIIFILYYINIIFILYSYLFYIYYFYFIVIYFIFILYLFYSYIYVLFFIFILYLFYSYIYIYNFDFIFTLYLFLSFKYKWPKTLMTEICCNLLWNVWMWNKWMKPGGRFFSFNMKHILMFHTKMFTLYFWVFLFP